MGVGGGVAVVVFAALVLGAAIAAALALAWLRQQPVWDQHSS